MISIPFTQPSIAFRNDSAFTRFLAHPAVAAVGYLLSLAVWYVLKRYPNLDIPGVAGAALVLFPGCWLVITGLSYFAILGTRAMFPDELAKMRGHRSMWLFLFSRDGFSLVFIVVLLTALSDRAGMRPMTEHQATECIASLNEPGQKALAQAMLTARTGVSGAQFYEMCHKAYKVGVAQAVPKPRTVAQLLQKYPKNPAQP